jgi:hypothetical protein
MAYHLLKANRTNEAESYLKPLLALSNSVGKLQEFEQVSVATLGLYAYKMNEVELGRKLYRRTITNFLNTGSQYLANSAFLNFFEEEVARCDNAETLSKLKKELDDLIPDDITKNELVIRKSNALKLFNEAMKKLSQV